MLVGTENGIPEENSTLALQNVQHRAITWDPAISSKELKPRTQADIFCTSIFTAYLFLIAKRWKQPNCPSIDE
jgi:hypothetical protein